MSAMIFSLHIDFRKKYYPTELVLKKTTESAHQLSHLDIICIQNKTLQVCMIAKRGFNIVNFPFLSSNNIAVQPA